LEWQRDIIWRSGFRHSSLWHPPTYPPLLKIYSASAGSVWTHMVSRWKNPGKFSEIGYVFISKSSLHTYGNVRKTPLACIPRLREVMRICCVYGTQVWVACIPVLRDVVCQAARRWGPEPSSMIMLPQWRWANWFYYVNMWTARRQAQIYA
jgi:hypothetical protein